MEKHAASEYPNEACGLIVNGRYKPCKNLAEDPTKSFTIDPVVFIEAVNTGKPVAVFHTHPFDQTKPVIIPHEWPSTADMVNWMNTNVPWCIASSTSEGMSELVWLDDSVRPPILGREFVHGITDCYSIIRDWYLFERNINLPNFARVYDWWLQPGVDLYGSNFKAAGFTEVSKDDVQVGDVALMQIRTNVINHAAIVTGTNQLTHHLFHRLSNEDRLDRWSQYIVKYVRYTKDDS